MAKLWNDNKPTHNEGYGPKPELERGIRQTMGEVIADARRRRELPMVSAERLERERRLMEAAHGLDKTRQHIAGLSAEERRRMLARLKPSDPYYDQIREMLLEAGAGEGMTPEELERWCAEQRKAAEQEEAEFQRKVGAWR